MISKFKFHGSIPRSEVPFKQIKALSEQLAIGVDYYSKLWKYTNGVWTFVRDNVRGASVNDNGVIYIIDNDNLIHKSNN